MATFPKSIKAIHQVDKTSSQLKLVETPFPALTPDSVLVKVAATSPCLGELWWARDFPALIPADREPVPGQDVAGTVVAVSESSTFKIGDEVYARIRADLPGGAREYTIVPEESLALKPKSLSWTEAAATPLSALTAWQAVFEQAGLEAAAVFGDEAARGRNAAKRVLITAAGGSVGGWAVQFAHSAGAGAIVSVNSADKNSRVKELGATEFIDYTSTSVDAWASENPKEREVDIVVDCIGGPGLKNLWGAVKDGGVFISIGGAPDSVKPEDNTKKLAKSLFFVVEPLGSQLAEISKLIEKGAFKILIDSVVEFDQYQEAFDRVESRKANGKVIIKVSV
jgi:NADPH:quinone reductase-like Zn-dependent oxidoreductase